MKKIKFFTLMLLAAIYLSSCINTHMFGSKHFQRTDSIETDGYADIINPIDAYTTWYISQEVKHGGVSLNEKSDRCNAILKDIIVNTFEGTDNGSNNNQLFHYTVETDEIYNLIKRYAKDGIITIGDEAILHDYLDAMYATTDAKCFDDYTSGIQNEIEMSAIVSHKKTILLDMISMVKNDVSDQML